ncbi:MAG TPA: hypothetical protein VN646_13630 [Candidatus Acidoferrum sp.]|nr:hypothetical protein [Candidatus Acidoferrum sp.]
MLLTAGQPAAHALADRPAEFAVLPELAIQPRRRHFEIVRLLDQAGGVEHIAQLSADALAVLDAHAARFVDEQPQHPARPVSPPLEVYERQPVIAEYGLNGLLDPELAFVAVHTTRQK